MDLKIIELEKQLNQKNIVFEEDILFDRKNQMFSISMEHQNLKLDVKLKLIQNETIELVITEYRMSSGNNQDYTQDGDPVYGG